MKNIPERLFLYLTESHLDSQGGYPFDSAVIGEEFVIAAIDDQDQSHLYRYPIELLFVWHEQAAKYKKSTRCDWTSAFIETAPNIEL